MVAGPGCSNLLSFRSQADSDVLNPDIYFWLAQSEILIHVRQSEGHFRLSHLPHPYYNQHSLWPSLGCADWDNIEDEIFELGYSTGNFAFFLFRNKSLQCHRSSASRHDTFGRLIQVIFCHPEIMFWGLWPIVSAYRRALLFFRYYVPTLVPLIA